jgi:hypothetical protein
MNTKIIVALVIGLVVIGLTGAASASLYDDYLARSYKDNSGISNRASSDRTYGCSIGLSV